MSGHIAWQVIDWRVKILFTRNNNRITYAIVRVKLSGLILATNKNMRNGRLNGFMLGSGNHNPLQSSEATDGNF